MTLVKSPSQGLDLGTVAEVADTNIKQNKKLKLKKTQVKNDRAEKLT